MQIAVISPADRLHYCNYGDMHMSLAHLVLKNEEYAAYYAQVAIMNFVILDNSAFELEQQGIGIPFDMVFDAARRTNPDEVIATDTLFKGPETIESTWEFIKNIPKDLEGKFRIMAVPQGRDRDEWYNCLEKLLEIPKVDTIGLSKLSVPACWEGGHRKSGAVSRSRVECAKTLNHRLWLKALQGKEIHLLGSDDWGGWELEQQERLRHEGVPIRSCDSSVTVWYGAHGERFSSVSGKMDQFIAKKPDLECEMKGTCKQIDAHETDILHNIATLHKFSKA